MSHAVAAQQMEYQYGVKIKYTVGNPINLLDFTITYQGERHVQSVVYTRGFYHYDFEIQKGNIRKVISWTAGTGDIAPTYFEFNEQRFMLELRMSDIVKILGSDELIIWNEDDFKQRLKRKIKFLLNT